jgi:hypothetical protein
MRDTLPIGYTEMQRSWVGGPDGEGPYEVVVNKYSFEMVAEMKRLQPDLVKITQSVVAVPDGDNVLHFTLYAGFAPRQPLSEPLNPRDLNDARSQNIGDPGRDNNIGAKEQKF